jgi:7,8-dihydropterin-6-yl-methyl-4-(beta-D-ribofuranosyl)aminobenzene 5'-phosphate synthase
VLAGRVAALAGERPELVVGAHCISFMADHVLYEAMPLAYRPSWVGSRFELKGAAPETRLA